VVRDDPDEEPWVEADPVNRPLASRNWVCVELPPLAWVVAVPTNLPEASRITARSMVWTIRPDESRTTSLQVCAGLMTATHRENTAGIRIAFIEAYDRIERQIIRFILHLQP
jgi:hypothetical protein